LWVYLSEVAPVRSGAALHSRPTVLGAYDRNGSYRKRTGRAAHPAGASRNGR